MPLPPPAGLLLDLDGTLVDTVQVRVDAWVAALDRFGIPAERDSIARLIGADGRRLAREIAEASGIPMRMSRAAEIDDLHGEIYGRLNTSPAVLPGVAELVDALERAGVPWAIATSSSPAAAETSIAALGLRVDPVLVDGSHVEHAKPAPELFLLGAERLGIAADEGCWCVGDAVWDMEAARTAGMTAIGVTKGSAVRLPTLRVAGAHRVVADLHELAELVLATATHIGS